MNQISKKRRVIFLDIDGVLCTMRSHKAFGLRGGLERHFDPVAVKMLEKLCEETGAKIVLSSSWRKDVDFESMTCVLMNAGFARVPWHSAWRTGDHSTKIGWGMTHSPPRGEEIKAWLDANGNPDYVILDDNSDFLPEQMPYLVQTDSYDGFLWKDYQKAYAIIRRK